MNQGPLAPFAERVELMEVALGRIPSDLVIIGGTIVDVNTGVLRKADIAVKGNRIALVGEVEHAIGESTRRVDAAGLVIAPGLIDAHMHVETSLVTAQSLAQEVLPRGNTTLVAEPHDWADVFGLRGMELLREQARHLPLRFFMWAPNRVPLTGPELGSTPHTMGPSEIETMIGWPEVIGLGKIMPVPVFTRDPQQMAKLSIALGTRKSLGARSDFWHKEQIQALAAIGLTDDYAARTADTMLERLQVGMKAIVSEGSTVPLVRELAKLLREARIDSRHCLLCTYDRFPGDIREKGFVDYAVRVLIEEGVPPATAIQMATINTAEHFGLARDLGSITPGRFADLVLIEDVATFKANSVYVGGELVARNGKVVHAPSPYVYPTWTRNTVTLPPGFGPETLRYAAPFNEGTVTVRAIGLVPQQISHDLTEEVFVELPVRHGEIFADPTRDLLKLVAIDRFALSGRIGRGIIRGVGFRRGAIAGTLAHDYYCIMAAGVSDEDIAFAVKRLAEIGGGFVVAAEGRVLAELQLEIGGLVTERSIDQVADECLKLDEAARGLGYCLGLPEGLHMALSFLSLPPAKNKKLRISDMGYLGLIEEEGVERVGAVPLVVERQSP